MCIRDSIETAVISTTGKAYGVELMAKKLTGKLNGWVSYTSVSYTHLRAHETVLDLVCRLLLETKKITSPNTA